MNKYDDLAQKIIDKTNKEIKVFKKELRKLRENAKKVSPDSDINQKIATILAEINYRVAMIRHLKKAVKKTAFNQQNFVR